MFNQGQARAQLSRPQSKSKNNNVVQSGRPLSKTSSQRGFSRQQQSRPQSRQGSQKHTSNRPLSSTQREHIDMLIHNQTQSLKIKRGESQQANAVSTLGTSNLNAKSMINLIPTNKMDSTQGFAKKVDLQAASMQGLPYLNQNHKKANTYLPTKNTSQPAAGYMIPIVKKEAIKRVPMNQVNASPNQIKSQSKQTTDYTNSLGNQMTKPGASNTIEHSSQSLFQDSIKNQQNTQAINRFNVILNTDRQGQNTKFNQQAMESYSGGNLGPTLNSRFKDHSKSGIKLRENAEDFAIQKSKSQQKLHVSGRYVQSSDYAPSGSPQQPNEDTRIFSQRSQENSVGSNQHIPKFSKSQQKLTQYQQNLQNLYQPQSQHSRQESAGKGNMMNQRLSRSTKKIKISGQLPNQAPIRNVTPDQNLIQYSAGLKQPPPEIISLRHQITLMKQENQYLYGMLSMGQAEDLQSFQWIKESIVTSINKLLLPGHNEPSFKVQDFLSPMRFLERLNEYLTDRVERMDQPMVINQQLKEPELVCDTANIDQMQKLLVETVFHKDNDLNDRIAELNSINQTLVEYSRTEIHQLVPSFIKSIDIPDIEQIEEHNILMIQKNKFNEKLVLTDQDRSRLKDIKQRAQLSAQPPEAINIQRAKSSYFKKGGDV